MKRADKNFMKLPEVAARLNISRSKAYELAAANVIPTIRLDKAVRVPRRGLEEWIAANTVPGSNIGPARGANNVKELRR